MDDADVIKVREFCIQALCGTIIASYRAHNRIPTDLEETKYLFANYLNGIHREVITGENNDEYIRKMLEDVVRHHSINCIIHVFFTIGSAILENTLAQLAPLQNSHDGHASTYVDELRNALTDYFENALPDFAEFFGHTCTGQTIEAMKKEIADGVFTPFFVFSSVHHNDN